LKVTVRAQWSRVGSPGRGELCAKKKDEVGRRKLEKEWELGV